jgi:hypothetical protein
VKKTALIVLTAGRTDNLDITIESLKKHLTGNILYKIIFDNSDGQKINYPGYKTIKVPSFGLPYGKKRHANVMQFIFDSLNKLDAEYICFFEEDWRLLSDVNVDHLISYLGKDLSQIRLFRKKKYPTAIEIDRDVSIVLKEKAGAYLFSWNPSVFKKQITCVKYPIDEDHELMFGKKLNLSFLVYKNRQEVVEHTGDVSISTPNGKWINTKTEYQLIVSEKK